MLLFEDQEKFYGIKEGDVPYVMAAFLVDKGTVGHLISTRRDGKIMATVAYYKGEQVVVKLIQEFTPAGFEQFFHELQQPIIASGNEVVEFNYRTRCIDDPHTAILTEEDQNLLTTFFLEAIAEGYERTNVYNAVTEKARELRAQMQ